MMILMPLLLLFISISVQAEIFHWFDSNGNKHFSDRPHQGAQILQVSPGHSHFLVKKVYDGDTILLTNGKKIRLLGINTPEVEGRNKSLQVGGEQAKQWLEHKLLNKKIRMEKDIEKMDKYGRLLAHVFTEDNEHMNLELVKQGLASVNIYPPNLKYTDILLKAEQHAEKQSLGIWGFREYQPKEAGQIRGVRFKGWQRVIGKIKNNRQTRKYNYLYFNDAFSLKIERKALSLFHDLDRYIGKKVEVRGWISKNKNQYSMFIRHPSAIKVINF